jgi:hypothetical protein
MGELRKMLTFLGSNARSLVSEASPSFTKVVQGEVVSHVKHPGLRTSKSELRGLDLAFRGVV